MEAFNFLWKRIWMSGAKSLITTTTCDVHPRKCHASREERVHPAKIMVHDYEMVQCIIDTRRGGCGCVLTSFYYRTK
jgi:hypothetical protein